LKLLRIWHRLVTNNYNNDFACRHVGLFIRPDRLLLKACGKVAKVKDQGVAV